MCVVTQSLLYVTQNKGRSLCRSWICMPAHTVAAPASVEQARDNALGRRNNQSITTRRKATTRLL